MIRLLKELRMYLMRVLRSKYKWFVLLFALWLYRVEFMPDTDGSFAKAIQVGSLGLISLLLLQKSPHIVTFSLTRTNSSISSSIWLYVFAMVSTLWAFIPQFAFFLSFQNVVMILLVVYLFSQCKSFGSLEKTFVYSIVLMGLFESICARIGNPRLIVHFLAGGSSAAMLLSYAVGEYINIEGKNTERTVMLKNTIIVAIVLLSVNTSGGANASALFGVGIAMFFGGKRTYAIVLVLTGLYLLANQDMIDDILLTVTGKEKELLENGNGRTVIWERILYYANQKPWFGWGFACAERIDQDVFGGQILSDAHNNYIGIYGSLGIVGCVFYGIHILRVFFSTFPNIKRVGFLGLFCAFCCACMNSYSYGFLSGKACSITIVYFMIVVLTFYYKKSGNYNEPRIKR